MAHGVLICFVQIFHPLWMVLWDIKDTLYQIVFHILLNYHLVVNEPQGSEGKRKEVNVKEANEVREEVNEPQRFLKREELRERVRANEGNQRCKEEFIRIKYWF